MKRKILLFSFYIAGLLIIRFMYNQDIATFRQHVANEHRIEAIKTRDEIQHKISLIYQGLRTIARMPALYTATNDRLILGKESRGTFQEIF